jgi:hypothetical protein
VEDVMKSGFLAGLVLFGAAAGALAQDVKPAEPAEQEQQEQEEARPAPAKKIKVLKDPYDIASFYRSNQAPAGGWFGSGYGDAAAPLGKVSENIAAYYRSRQQPPAYYSQFWASGYGGSYGATRGRRFPYGRRIGAHGDLFLIAPTIFAPVGPLTGWFGLKP